MAQIVVRGINDDVMRRFREYAKTQGKSAEQVVRELIERAAAEAEAARDWFEQVNAFREQMRRKYGDPDAAT